MASFADKLTLQVQLLVGTHRPRLPLPVHEDGSQPKQLGIAAKGNRLLLLVFTLVLLYLVLDIQVALKDYSYFQEKDIIMNRFAQVAPALINSQHATSNDVLHLFSRETPFNPRLAPAAYMAYFRNLYAKSNHAVLQTTTDDPAAAVRLRVEHSTTSWLPGVVGTTIPFHWDDWVDLGPAHVFQAMYNRQHGVRDLDLNSHMRSYYEFIQDAKQSKQPIEVKMLKGKVELYLFFPSPHRVCLLSDNHHYMLPVLTDEKTARTRMGPERLEQVYRRFKTPDEEYLDNAGLITLLDKEYLSHLPPNNARPEWEDRITIPQEEYDFDFHNELGRLQATNPAEKTPNEMEYQNTLAWTLRHHGVIHLHFRENHIFFDGKGEGQHLLSLFLVWYIGEWERHLVIHHMNRAWFTFTQQVGVTLWINYGNLIGWYFNGANLFFDEDIDVQLTISGLHTLGKDFNRTLVMEDPRFGSNGYYLEINPWIGNLNRENVIDGRFIDTRTLLYIDLSGLLIPELGQHIPEKYLLTEEDKKDSSVVDKNANWQLMNRIGPLRLTLFEGAQLYIPNDIEYTLGTKYLPELMTQTHFRQHHFDPELGLWIPETACAELPKDGKWGDGADGDRSLTLHGACGDVRIQKDWTRWHKYYKLHQEEMAALKEGQDVARIVHTKFSAPLLPDPHDEYVRMYQEHGHGNVMIV